VSVEALAIGISKIQSSDQMTFYTVSNDQDIHECNKKAIYTSADTLQHDTVQKVKSIDRGSISTPKLLIVHKQTDYIPILVILKPINYA